VITFQGTTVDELIQAFQDSIDDYIDWCEERRERPEKPFSGKFNLHKEQNQKRDIKKASVLLRKHAHLKK
jgi:predicted HicB family RNase H-like nuclease